MFQSRTRYFRYLAAVAALAAGIAAGRDNQIRAWDSETGRQLWSSRFGGNFAGQLAMYEMDGRQYLLVPAASSAGGGRGGTQQGTAATIAPLGWVAYALPVR
jgi:glucose dehydrogenase